MRSKTPLISILIPSYNHQNFIEQCIKSVLAQTYENFELIVVDDCSTDETAARIKEINDDKVTFIQNSFNRGLNGNLNVAFEKSTGDYIAVIGSDDFFDENYIQAFISFINDEKEKYSVYYPKIVHVDDFGNLLEKQPSPSTCKTSSGILKNLFLYGNFLSSPGMIMPRNTAKQIFPLDAGIHQHQDYIMHIQLLLLGEPAFMPDVKVCYRVPTDDNGHMSSNCVKATKRIEIETPFAQNYFVKGIKTPEKLKEIFGDMATKYGEPTKETIPYFLSRIALDAIHNRFLPVWGFRTLIEFLSADNHQDLLYKLYGFQYKDFSALFNNVRLLDDYLQEQQQTFYSSTSWKITKPLRSFNNFLQKLKREK